MFNLHEDVSNNFTTNSVLKAFRQFSYLVQLEKKVD